jgi:FAD/FMN-containing dehydrogenase
MKEGFNQALSEFKLLLGNEGVLDSVTAQNKYGNSTLGIKKEILLALRPKSEEQVVSIVAIANRYHISLYTISTGKNWGYGSAVPTSQNSVILDLSQLLDIKILDEDTGLISVGPGVTQNLLADFLAKRDLNFSTPTTGAHGTCSIIGNFLEYGMGSSVDMEHFESVCSLRVVLGNGEIFESNSPNLPSKWKLGPYFDGLFMQSNFGIVLNATLLLSKKTEKSRIFSFEFDSRKDLKKVIFKIRESLEELPHILVYLKIFSDDRLVSRRQRVKAKKDYFSNLYTADAKGKWLVVGVISANSVLVGAAEKVLKSKFKSISELPLFFFSEKNLNILSSARFPLPFILKEKYIFLLGSLRLAMGFPIRETNKVVFSSRVRDDYSSDSWNNFLRSNLNPDIDENLGFLFFSCTFSANTEIAFEAIQSMEKICLQYGFPFNFQFTGYRSTYFKATIFFAFNKKNDAEAKKAFECYEALVKEGEVKNFYLNRGDIRNVGLRNEGNLQYWKLVDALKKFFDKNGILSKDRYSIS